MVATVDPKVQASLDKARANASAMASAHPSAANAYFDEQKMKVVVIFNDETEFAFPPELAQGLENASAEDLSEVEITPSGLGLHWEVLDADLSIPELIQGIYGSKKWMADLGKRGGQSTSVAKAAASRANGKKGGRPRKSVSNAAC